MEIILNNVNKAFGQFKALNDINLNIESGELIALLGSSGSGKTTLLRIIAGLEFADAGAVYFGGEDVVNTPLHKRQIGFVFQHYALFKHMTVRDNVSFGLRILKSAVRPSRRDIADDVNRLLDLVQLKGLGDRYPHQLSGGQRQRVALARALAISPKVLLLDEPFGALDAKVRKELRQWLRELHQKTGVTTIFVTHDQEEALELADRVVIMSEGKIAQVGSVDEVYERPASPLVFDFLGSTNRIVVTREGDCLLSGKEKITAYHGPIRTQGTVFVRPSDLRVAKADELGLSVVIKTIQRTGPLVRVMAETIETRQAITVEMPHLHHDVQVLRPNQHQRLKLQQFSLYPLITPMPHGEEAVPGLIGRERVRSA